MERKIGGTVLIILGLIFLGMTFDLISIPLGKLISYWPIGLILVGISLCLRQKVLAFVFFVTTIFFLAGGAIEAHSEPPKYYEGSFDDPISSAKIDIDLGAARLQIDESQNSPVEYKVLSSSEPIITTKDRDGVTVFDIENSFHSLSDEEWNISIQNNIPTELSIDTGLSELHLDLREIQINKLNIDAGASEINIYLPARAIHVEIDAGASAIHLHYPRFPISVAIDAGASSTDLDLRELENGAFASEDYTEDADAIRIEIDAGASSIEGDYYD